MQHTNTIYTTTGWIPEQNRVPVSQILPEDVLEAIEKATLSECPISRLTKPIADIRRIATALKLTDWNHTTSATLLRLQDVHRTYPLIESVRKITAASSEEGVVAAMLDSLKQFGHKSAQIYLLNSITNSLQAWAQFGFDPNVEPDAYYDFARHRFFLKCQQESPNSWRCFAEGTPPFRELSSGHDVGQCIVTSTGLEFLLVDDSGCDHPNLQKTIGDTWIELPLHSPEKNQIYGKITANVPEQMSLYDVEHLKILAEACSAAFSAIRELDRRQMVFDALRRSDRNQAIIDFRHGLVSDLRSVQAGIKNAINRPIERKNKKLEQLLLRMERIIGQRTQTLRNMTAQQAPIIEPQDLRKLIEESIISPGFNALHISTSTADCSFIVNCNKDQMQVAFSELLENSRLANEANDVDRNNTSIQLVLSHIKEGGTRFVQIDYMDNGCGVQPRNLTKIFSRNCSFWPPKLYRLGGGNGLSVVATAVTDAGGRIWAEPRTGGVHFVIQIPATE
jgi:signal transduction histidine kinase